MYECEVQRTRACLDYESSRREDVYRFVTADGKSVCRSCLEEGGDGMDFVLQLKETDTPTHLQSVLEDLGSD